MRKAFFTLTFLVLFVSVGVAQEKPTTFSVLLGYSGAGFKPNPAEAAEYANGIFVEGNGRILAKRWRQFRLDGTINFKRSFAETLAPEYRDTVHMRMTDIKRNVDTISVGPKVSFGVAGPVRLYGTALFGVKNFRFNPNTGGDDYKQFSRRYQVGLDLELGHFLLRPFFYERECTKGPLGCSSDSYGGGAGFKF